VRLRSHQHEPATSYVIVADLSPAAAAAAAAAASRSTSVSSERHHRLSAQPSVDFTDKFVIDDFI